MPGVKSIMIENRHFCLKLSENCVAESLVLKSNGEECLEPDNTVSFFTLTQNRPYNNEIKLTYPNKRTIFSANRVRREGDNLIVGFELVSFEAVVTVRETDDYIAFTLKDFIVKPSDFEGLMMSPPPVSEFRLIQLPVKPKPHFGKWLNVMWDEKSAVNVLSVSPHARIDSELRKDCRILTADAIRGIKLKGCTAALIACDSQKLLDCIDTLEHDYNLPLGVESRRNGKINISAYWGDDITPENIDEHLAYVKKGGFGKMLLYFSCLYKDATGFHTLGNYEFRDEYPEGVESLRKMLRKIKEAGIIPGFHFLHTHIGVRSRYVTPVADHRLNLTTRFTLARPLSATDTTVYVEQNPEDSVMCEPCRVLKFDGELIKYSGYTTEYPYCFTGCTRGHHKTNVTSHAKGCIGGILDISEYEAESVYLDQNTDLQDEIADILALAYDAGFEYVYFDGSEGTNPPFEYHVANAQYRVYKKFRTPPLLCEGAAKVHFGWHMLSGGNAFDIFATDVFKQKLAEHPLKEAPLMADDFTALNFGWWAFYEDTTPDIYEYGTSKAAAWDCPVTIQANLEVFKSNPHTDAVLEVMRRWEDVRVRNLLTPEQKELLKDPAREFTLIINEKGECELRERI